MMKLLKEIYDKSLSLGEGPLLNEKYIFRKSARGIVLNENGEMAVQHLTNRGYHKLPGGGVDRGEAEADAFKREVLEEVGCDCELIEELGVVIECRNEQELLHISYGYVAKLIGAIGLPMLEAEEVEEGQVTKWLKPEEALEQMKNDQPTEYKGHFIRAREVAFLEGYFNK